MFPTLFGCRSAYELTQVRVWDKNLPGRLLGALPKQKWIRQLQQRGQALLIRLWQQVTDKSPATQSLWQWTWVADDSVFKKAGQQLGGKNASTCSAGRRPFRRHARSGLGAGAVGLSLPSAR